MLYKEALWLGDLIGKTAPTKIFPMLNIGSSTAEFRKKTQPWIDGHVFDPATEKGFCVVHTDIKEAPGVDISGDFNDPEFVVQLAAMGFNSVLCSNLLEHVENRQEICERIETIVRPGGYVIVTCPYEYPYHPDPIDTLFRPTPCELEELFRHSKKKTSTILSCGTHFDRLVRNPRLLFRTIARLCLPVYKPGVWWQTLVLQRWLFREFRVSCVVLEKQA